MRETRVGAYSTHAIPQVPDLPNMRAISCDGFTYLSERNGSIRFLIPNLDHRRSRHSLCDYGGFVAQINHLVTAGYSAETVSGYDHREFASKAAQCLKELGFSGDIERAGCLVHD
jgi:hypothetical protein